MRNSLALALFALLCAPTSSHSTAVDIHVHIKTEDSGASCDNSGDGLAEETRSLDEIHRAALAEGGRVVVYAGGDAKGQQDGTKQAFEKRFPNMTMDVVVDYSVVHGPRIDVQLETDSLVPDVVQGQTVEDYPRWKGMDVLMAYKPNGWSQVHKEYRDEEGHYTATLMFVFSTLVSQNITQWPRTAKDFLKPEFGGGKMALVHPNFDDAILFYIKQIVDRYGWEWLAQFARQKPVLVCGGEPVIAAVQNGSVPVGIAGDSNFPIEGVRVASPASNDPLTIYAMYTAIFKRAKHLEAAKLYLNWQLSKESAANSGTTWSVRTDVLPKGGQKPVWELPNSSHGAFLAFMQNHEQRYRFARQVALFLGESRCDQTSMAPSLHPPQN